MWLIRELTISKVKESIPLNPEEILHNPRATALVTELQRRYREYIPNTWKWEIDAQKALERKEYQKSFEIYENWYKAFIEYQTKIADVVYKAHPLFNAAQSLLLGGKEVEAGNFFFLSYVEEVIAELQEGEVKNSPSFRMLSLSKDIIPNLSKIETLVSEMKKAGEDLSNPSTVLNAYAKIEVIANQEFEKQKKDIIEARDAQKKQLKEDLSQYKSMDTNVLYVLKQWNSATPRFPHKNPETSFGGGFFLVWNKKGIVIDPGYDFLKHFYGQGFGPKNINLIIVTHAHEDHCQDLEPIFSALYKFNRDCEKHKVDVLVSEGTHIKYSRLFAINRATIHDEILQQGKTVNIDDVFRSGYKLVVRGTKTVHHEEPWMKNNTGTGLVLSLKDPTGDTQIGFTSDTAFWEGIINEFSGANLIVANIGTYGESSNHLCDTGCLELLKGCIPSPSLVVVSEFGEELKGKRVKVCSEIETLAMWQTVGERIPVIAGDVGLQISIPKMQILCENTGHFEDVKLVIDKEDNDRIHYYLKK